MICNECNDKGCPACTLPPEIKFYEEPEFSGWRLYIYGSKPGNGWESYIRVVKRKVPNFFVRWMMKSIGCTWVEEKNENK